MAGTRWVRLDVDYFRNPKAMAAGKDGRALHLASICWSASQLTDGRIPTEAIRLILSDAGVTTKAIDRCVNAGLWIPDPHLGYIIKDYADMNPTRVEVEAERSAARERARRSRRNQGTGQFEK